MIKCCKICLSIIIVFILLEANLPGIRAAQYRHHQAHEHGVAHLNVALEGNDLFIEFTSPAANIVGFEHHPRTDEQKAAVRKAIETLKAGESLFVLALGAEGNLAESTVTTDIEDDSNHESENEHAEALADSSKETLKVQHPSGKHHEADEHEPHSDFKAEYHFDCREPQRLAHIEVMLFRIFPGIEHIEVQLLTGTKQTALELTAQKNRIIF
jgi:hypothetical protein